MPERSCLSTPTVGISKQGRILLYRGATGEGSHSELDPQVKADFLLLPCPTASFKSDCAVGHC